MLWLDGLFPSSELKVKVCWVSSLSSSSQNEAQRLPPNCFCHASAKKNLLGMESDSETAWIWLREQSCRTGGFGKRMVKGLLLSVFSQWQCQSCLQCCLFVDTVVLPKVKQKKQESLQSTHYIAFISGRRSVKSVFISVTLVRYELSGRPQSPAVSSHTKRFGLGFSVGLHITSSYVPTHLMGWLCLLGEYCSGKNPSATSASLTFSGLVQISFYIVVLPSGC